jgi:hypothetical protein
MEKNYEKMDLENEIYINKYTGEIIDLPKLRNDTEEIKYILDKMALDDNPDKQTSAKNHKFRKHIIVNCTCLTNCSLNNYPKHLLSKSHTQWIDNSRKKMYCYNALPMD